MELHYKVPEDKYISFISSLGEILGWEAQYDGDETGSYTIGNYTVDKEGTVNCPTAATPEIVDQLIENLKQRGFEMTGSNENTLTVELPRSLYDDDALTRLNRLIDSKSTLLKKAFKTESLPVEITEDLVKFPWFTLRGVTGEAKAYGHLVCAMANYAKNAHFIKAKETDYSENYRYAMRMFLIRLGFNGTQYKAERKILFGDLPGSCSKGFTKAKKSTTAGSVSEAVETTDEQIRVIE